MRARRVVRQIVAPNGRHRRRPARSPLALAERRPAGAPLTLVQMMRSVPPLWPAVAAQGYVAAQIWGDCPDCGVETTGVLGEDGWICGECGTSGSGDDHVR